MLHRFLRPFSSLYALVTGVRNKLYDSGLKPVLRPAQATISVGNLTVGGTGKTPMIEYLVERLSGTYRVATLSRGYGRQTRGFRLAGPTDTAQTIGDEPLQLYRKFGTAPDRSVLVAVGERRADALRHLHRTQPQVDVVLLDDALQHRAVQPALNLLLTDVNRPFYADHPFPEGRLRESRYGARRADAVLVTKCPDDLSESEQARMAGCLRPYTRPDIPVFFTGLHYGLPISFATQQAVETLTDVVLVSGLANADALERYVSREFRLLRHERFADHYAYTRSDYERLRASLPPGAALLTTEKDWVKLDALLTGAERVALYYLPITVRFLAGESAFGVLMQRAIG
ncbi:MAG: tetraacyldisaccharide 4'-kinase [Bacteroidetes bacterium]|nr:tetraacyldisaccharide 4'-kinase [Fibrella sp.]